MKDGIHNKSKSLHYHINCESQTKISQKKTSTSKFWITSLYIGKLKADMVAKATDHRYS